MVCEFYLNKLLGKKDEIQEEQSETKDLCCLLVGRKSMKENENWNVEKRMSGERYFTEYLCSHGNFQYIKKEKKKLT